MRETVRCVIGRAKTLALVCAVALLFMQPSRATGVVCAGREPLPAPENGFVGWWNGSSAVCVGPRQIISAGHVGGSIGGVFWMRGTSYHAVSIRQHPTQDVQIIELAETLPGFHRLADSVQTGDRAVLGGFGRTAGNQLDDGYDWSGAQAETWGENTIDNAAWLIVISFTNPAEPEGGAVPHEAAFAINDSGAGLFVRGPQNELRLAGVAVSVSGLNESRYGSPSFCLNVSAFRSWMDGCLADFDRSGEITPEDLFQFVESWTTHADAADLNGDGQATFEDMLLFIRAYLRGC